MCGAHAGSTSQWKGTMASAPSPYLLALACGPALPEGRPTSIVNGQREEAEEKAHTRSLLVKLQLGARGQPAQEVPAAGQ